MAKKQNLNSGKLVGAEFEANFENADVKSGRGALARLGLVQQGAMNLETITDLLEGNVADAEISPAQIIKNVGQSLESIGGGKPKKCIWYFNK